MRKSRILEKTAALVFTAVFLFPITIFAQGNNTLEKKQVYAAFDSGKTATFENVVQEDGRTFNLRDIKYTILDEKEVEKTPDYTVVLSELLSKKEAEEKLNKEITETINGKEESLVLKEIRYKEDTVKNRTQTVTATKTFSLDTELPSIPQVSAFTFRDNETGESLSAEIPLVTTNVLQDWHWARDSTIPMTVRVYDAMYYRLGETNSFFERNDQKPALDGKESAVLEVLGLSTDRHRVVDYSWSSDIYTEGGIQYRDFDVILNRYVASTQAVYEGIVSLPDLSGFEAIGEYYLKNNLNSTEYTIEATATYELEQTGFTPLQIVIGALGVLIICLFIAFVLYKMRKKQKNNISTA